MPITRPSPSNSGPPELPRLIGASIWIAFETAKPPWVSESIDRPVAETTPTESEVCLPNGLPIAATGSPTDHRRRVAERHGVELVVVGRDADHADVAEEIPADDLRRDALAVGELDVHGARALDVRPRLGGVRDHVGVREDHAVLVDDEPRSLRLAVDAQVGVDRHDAGRARGVERLRIEGARRRGAPARPTSRSTGSPPAARRSSSRRRRRPRAVTSTATTAPIAAAATARPAAARRPIAATVATSPPFPRGNARAPPPGVFTWKRRARPRRPAPPGATA